MDSFLDKMNYSAETASGASRQASARNIADSAVTWLQPRSNMDNDAPVVRDHVTFRVIFRVTFRVTFGFQPINSGAYLYPGQLLNFKNVAYI